MGLRRGPGRSLALFAALASVLLGTASALYEKGGPVVVATARSWDKVEKSSVPVVVEFFAPWCGHCKNLAPEYTAAATKLQGIVPFVAVDCDREANRPLCARYGVQGYPTLKLFSPGSAAPTDYQGPREAKPLASAAVALLTSKHVKRITSLHDLAALMAATDKTKVVLVTDKKATPPMFKSLSQRFSAQGLAFAEVVRSPENKDLLAGQGITKAPALLAVPAGKGPEGKLVYDGELKAPKILEWLKQLAQQAGGSGSAGSKPNAKAGKEGAAEKERSAGKEGSGQSAGGKQQKEEGEEKAVPAEIPKVVANVTAGELARRLGKEGVIVLSFFAGGEGACREHLNKLNAGVHGLQGLASGVQVDLSDAKEAAAVQDQYGVSLPEAGEGSCETRTFLLPFDVEDHEDSDEWRAYSQALTPKDLHKAALELFPAGGITPLTAESHRQWVGTDPLRPKVILFTDKEDPPALLRALSCNFRRYRMSFGMAHSGEAELLKQFNVPRTPFILAIIATPDPDGKPDANGQPALKFGMQPYVGPIRYGGIATWLTVLGIQTGTAPEDAFEQFAAASGQKAPDSMVAQITDQESWQASCLSQGGVCIVAALSPDQQQQAEQLAVLRQAAAGRAEQPLHFSWFELGGGGAAFAQQLGLEGGQAPALVALAPRKERSAVLTGRFEKDTIKEWLDGLLSGKVRTAPVQRLPDFPAAGSDAAGEGAAAGGEEAPVEEEFDLSEIMGEEVEGDLSKRHAGERKDEL